MLEGQATRRLLHHLKVIQVAQVLILAEVMRLVAVVAVLVQLVGMDLLHPLQKVVMAVMELHRLFQALL
jgi:hypothetical protein